MVDFAAGTREIESLREPGNGNSVQKKQEESSGRRRERPPLKYSHDFPTPDQVKMTTIGVVRSPYKERFGCPRQPQVFRNTLGNEKQHAEIHLHQGQQFELALKGLEEFSHCWVIFAFHLNEGWNPQVRPPRGPRKKQGIFATRSPHRPNPIGLSCLNITKVEVEKRIIHVHGVDLIDGTPVLDIKPYVPYADCVQDAKAGWLDKLNEDMIAPDTLGYFPPPAHLLSNHPIDETNKASKTTD